MINKYNNPRLHNTVLTGPGMTHPRNPHVVIGSDEQGFIQGDLMDANAIMETIDQKIDIDNLLDEEKLNNAIQDAVNTATERIRTALGEIQNTLETKADKEDVPKKITDLEFGDGVLKLAPPKLGDYLYEDFTYGETEKEGWLGRCVGTPDMFSDNTYRWATALPAVKWQDADTEDQLVDTDLTNISRSDDAKEDIHGYENTQTLKQTVSLDQYPALSTAISAFNGRGYLPAAGELWICRDAIDQSIGWPVFYTYAVWSSTEMDRTRVWVSSHRGMNISSYSKHIYGDGQHCAVYSFFKYNPNTTKAIATIEYVDNAISNIEINQEENNNG